MNFNELWLKYSVFSHNMSIGFMPKNGKKTVFMKNYHEKRHLLSSQDHVISPFKYCKTSILGTIKQREAYLFNLK